MTSIPTLALNGEAILLKNMRVTVSQQFQDKDQSGQTSATTKSEQGAKGKELRISGEIPFKNPEILKRIFELASATDADGKRMKYRVAHEVARAVNFREATFSGMLDAPPQDGKWPGWSRSPWRNMSAYRRSGKPGQPVKQRQKNRRPAVRDNPVARVPERMKKTDVV